MDLALGKIVRYHPIIGGPDDGKDYEIRTLQRTNNQWLVWLKGKGGCVSADALSDADEKGHANDA